MIEGAMNYVEVQTWKSNVYRTRLLDLDRLYPAELGAEAVTHMEFPLPVAKPG